MDYILIDPSLLNLSEPAENFRVFPVSRCAPLSMHL